MIARRAAPSIAAFFICAVASALPRDRSIGQLHHTAWTAKDGAPSQISALAQTTDGYLWIGTARGLYRFDGVEFEPFVPHGVELPSHNIYSLLPTPDGELWIAFRPSGLGFWKDGRMTVLSRPEELPDSQVYVMARDGDGRLWAGTHTGLVLRSGSKWIAIGAAWNFQPRRIRALLVDRDGTLWVATDTTVVFLRRGAKTFEPTGVRVKNVMKMTEANDGVIWVSELEPASDATRSPNSRVTVGVNAFDILFDRDGALWEASDADVLVRVPFPTRPADGVYSLHDAGSEHFGESDGLTADPLALLEDHEGNIWVGTNKGLDRFRYSHVVPVPLPAGHAKLTLLAGSAGDLWAGSALDPVLDHLEANRVTTLPVADGVSSVYRDRNGDVWWGGHSGMSRQRGTEFTRFPQPPNTIPDWMWEIVRDDNGGLWVSLGDEGLVHFNDGVWSRTPPPKGLLARGPSATFHDEQGRIWFGYTENRVALLDHGRVSLFTKSNGIDIGRIRVIRGHNPLFWFGGELGLAMFFDGRFHDVIRSGADRFGTVSGIIETSDGAVWLNEMDGIIRISPGEVRRLAADPAYRVHVQRFDFLDGLPGSPQMNWTVSTAVETTDGRLWFSTDNGLARIDPRALRINTLPPPVRIRSITADREYAPEDHVRLPIGTRQLQIRYTALSFSIPERVKFRYMLEGFDREWQDAGTRRVAYYTNLRPGHYRFHVSASNNDGAWNESGAALAFELPPAFYQTRWFVALAVVIAGILISLAFWLRMRYMIARLQRLHDERMDERMRITHELHDTLLQGFLSASMQLHAANEQMAGESPAKRTVTNVLTLIGKVNEEGRHALRGLRVSQPTESLEDSFGHAAQDLSVPQDVAFRIVAEGPRRPLEPLVRDQIYRIGREAIANAFRHSAAKEIEVEVEYLARSLILRVRDDGRGIDPDVMKSREEDHWGFAGMQERAKNIGGRLRVSSDRNAGTEVELSVPGRIAYRDGTPLHRLRRLFRLSG